MKKLSRVWVLLLIAVPILLFSIMIGSGIPYTNRTDSPYSFMQFKNIKPIARGIIPVSISPNDEWLLGLSAPDSSFLAYNLKSHNIATLGRTHLHSSIGGIWFKTQGGRQEFALDYFTAAQLPFSGGKEIVKRTFSYEERARNISNNFYFSDIGFGGERSGEGERLLKTDKISTEFAYTISVNDNENIKVVPVMKDGLGGQKTAAYEIIYQKDGNETLLRTVKAKFISLAMLSKDTSVSMGFRSIKLSLNKKFIALYFTFWHYHILGAWGNPSNVHRNSLYLVDVKRSKVFFIDENFGILGSDRESPGILGVDLMAFTADSERLFYVSKSEIKCIDLTNTSK